MKDLDGIYLVPPHGEWIASGLKTLIVKSRKFSKFSNPLYIISDEKCYGIITLDQPEEITPKEFERLREKHRISDEEAFEIWKWEKDRPLYSYTFKLEKVFDPPLKVTIPQGVQTFVSSENIKFSNELIRDWRTYDPSKISDAVLRDDWRIANAWKSTLERTQKPFESEQFKGSSFEEQLEIVNDLLDSIGSEMKKRGWSIEEDALPGDLEQIDDVYLKKLNDDQLLAVDKELHMYFDKIKKVTEPLHDAHVFTWNEMRRRGIPHEISDGLTAETALDVIEYPKIVPSAEEITLEEVLQAFPQNILVKEDPVHIYLTGRIVNEGKIPLGHDLDMIVKQLTPDRRLVNAITTAVYKMNPEIAKRLHVTFDPEGPMIGLTVPMYRLSFSRTSPAEQIKRSPWSYLNLAQTVCTPLFQKPRSGFHKFEFFTIEELWAKYAIDYIDEGLIINKKWDGMSFFICRDGEDLKIITEDKKEDRVKYFPLCAEELLTNSKSKNFAINAEMIWHKSLDTEEQYRREEMIGFIAGTKEVPKDDTIIFHVHDCVWFEGESLIQKGYHDRYETLKKIIPPDLKHWKIVPEKIVNTKKEFYQAVEYFRRIPGSEGAMIKTLTGTYSLTGRTNQMAKIKNLKEVDVMIWDIDQKKTAEGKPLQQWIYYPVFQVPCDMEKDIREEDVIHYENKCFAKIGRTYSTGEKLEKGDIIIVRPIQILENKDDDGKLYWTWMFPYFEGEHPVKKEPDTLTTIRRIVEVGTSPLEKLSDPFVALATCPYYSDGRLCILKHRFIGPVSLRKQSLKFPVRCRLANIFRCPYVKKYYYSWEEEED